MIFVAILVLALVLCFQICFTGETRDKIILLKQFFPKDGLKYRKDGLSISLDDDNNKESKYLSEIIQEINVYLSKNEGTADFSILMNMVERKINILYSDAVAKISFPTFCGLLGTFLGVFIGLLAFNWGLDAGIHDSMIQELIIGVIVSMITSVIGLICSIGLNWFASNVRKDLDRRKNEFYHFMQTELLPELGTDMVSSIAKLRKTINLFEPTFKSVISRFEDTFNNCTTQFGEAFRENVEVVAQAVTTMGENINTVNDNIRFQQKILDTFKSKELNQTLDKFVNLISQFDELSQSLSLFEQCKSEVIIATQELTNAQRTYNQSLSIPKELVNDVNQLLNRIRTFEDNVNLLGEELKQSELIGNKELNLIENQLRVLRDKNAVASSYVDSTTEELISFFDSQKASLKNKITEWNQMLMNYGDEYENIVNQIQKQMKDRWNEFVNQMNGIFDTSEMAVSLHHLNQLKPILEKIGAIEAKLADSKAIQKKLNEISGEVASVSEIINSMPTPSVPQPVASNNKSNVVSDNIDVIQKSITGLQKRLDAVSQMGQRINEIKSIVERIQLPQISPENMADDNTQYQQRLVSAHDKIKQLQTELDSIKQGQKDRAAMPMIEDLKQQLSYKEETILQLQEKLRIAEKPWYKRIIGK